MAQAGTSRATKQIRITLDYNSLNGMNIPSPCSLILIKEKRLLFLRVKSQLVSVEGQKEIEKVVVTIGKLRNNLYCSYDSYGC